MTHSNASPNPPANFVTELLKPRWGWIVASGVLTLLFGIFALRMPLGAVFAMTMLFGAYALADGVLSIITALRDRRKGAAGGHFWPLMLRGILGLFAGIIVLKAFRDKVGSQVYLETPTTYKDSERFDILS